jgi:hypothetical protein
VPEKGPRVEFGKSAEEREVDRLEEVFWDANRHTLDKPKLRRVVTDIDTRRKSTFVASVKREDLGEYGLEVPEWDDGRAEFALWTDSQGEYELPAPRMDYTQTPSTRKATNVDQGVYFDHLPGGFKQFRNKREAAAWLSRNMPDVSFRD